MRIDSRQRAADVQRGDVFRTAAMTIMCPTPPLGALYSRDLQWKQYLATGRAIAFDSVGNLYSVDGTALDVFDTSLHKIRTVAIPEAASALAVSGAGFAYVAGESGTVFVYSPGGVWQSEFTLPSAAESIDIAPEGCTLVYVGAVGVVNRFDVCAGVALPRIAQDERFTAIRALRDGGFAGATASRIEIWNGAGQMVHSVNIPNERFSNEVAHVAALAFDVDPDYIVLVTNSGLMKMNVRNPSGAITDALNNPFGVAVFGEERPSPSRFATPAKRRGAGH